MKSKIYLINIFLPALLVCAANRLSAQNFHDFGFKKDLSVPVFDSAGTVEPFAWAGGMNSCQFSQIDLNLDGIKDLMVFDRNGNRILTFINHGTAGSVDYEYAPQYQAAFPIISDWVRLIDYDGDGKEDLFTYTVGGMKVFRNISDSVLKFKLVTPLLTSYQYNGFINLYVSLADYPVIADIDGDGDLDILTFFSLGTYVQYHKNLSMEKYGNADSLTYKLTEMCWGHFKESPVSNQLILNDSCPYTCSQNSFQKNSEDAPRHTGSTLLALDANDDSVSDLLIGDVGYNGLMMLYNGGTKDSAWMVSQDTVFPSNSRKINLCSFPAADYVDIDNDGAKDLLVSPFDPALTNAENQHSVWLYKNTGTNSSPVFEFQTDNFLQSKMIDVGSGAYPVLFDYDGDGLQDLFIGNYGILDSSWVAYGILHTRYRSQIALYKNTGAPNYPEFQLITNDFANLSALKLVGCYPAFADLDGDGDADMLVGNSNGNLLYFENTASPGNLPDYHLRQTNYQNIDAGEFCTPQLFDLDGDSLPDLIFGKRNGTLDFYKNTGTKSNPVFTLITDHLGNVSVTDTMLTYYGYSVPCFFKAKDGKLKLFAGSEFGAIFYYNDIENHLTDTFNLAESKMLGIAEGWRTGVAIADLDNDGYPDMIAGNYAGGLAYYKGVTPPPMGIGEKEILPTSAISLYPNPADDQLSVTLSDIFNTLAYRISVYDLLGKPLITKTYHNTNHVTINLNSLSNGMYLCRLSVIDSFGNYRFAGTGKFIVNH